MTRRSMNRAGARLTIVGFLLIASLSACASPHSVISTAASGLRTFSVIRDVNGSPMVCPAFALLDPVSGTFDGRAAAREPGWITGADGRQLSIVWPEGFTVQFEPDAVLYNEKGQAVAWAHRPTELPQVSPGSHAGTYDDPYIASGILFGGCYPFVP